MEIGYLSEVKAILKSLIISSPSKITVAQLNRDYKDFEGELIPFRRLGFNSLDNFLRSIPDTLAVMGSGDAAYVDSVAIGKSKHIRDMIMHQKTPKTNGRSGSKSSFGYSNRNQMVKSYMHNSGRSHNNFQSAGQPSRPKDHQFSPFQITNRNVSTRTVGVRDVPVKQTPSNTDLTASYTAPQPLGMKMQSSSNKEHQNKNEAKESVETGAKQNSRQVEIKHLKTAETPQNFHNPNKYEEMKLLEERLNTTCHVTAPASAFSFDMQESTNKATVTQRAKKLQNGFKDSTSYPLNKGMVDAAKKDKELLDSSDANVMDFNAAVPEFALNSSVYRLNFPKYTVPFGSEIPSYKMPDNVDVDTCIGVFITEIHSPFKFWFHMSNEEHELDFLMNEMENLYTSLEPHELRLTNMLLITGQVCAVIFNDVWYRAEIVAPPVGDKIKVCLLDYGTVAEVNIMEIKYLVSCFADIPAQAMRGCLSHIKPRGPRWSHEATMHFLSSVKEIILFAKISVIDKENMVFFMVLCDTNGYDVLQINTDLIAKGYALYDEDWQERNIIEKN